MWYIYFSEQYTPGKVSVMITGSPDDAQKSHDTKEEIKKRKSKDRPHNGQTKEDKQWFTKH